MGIPARENPRLFSLRTCVNGKQMQHGLNAERGTGGGVKGIGAKKRAGKCFTFRNDAMRCKKIVGTVKFGNVKRFEPENRNALVSGHMQPDWMAFCILPHKIANRRAAHSASPSSRAMATAIAHSIRLRKSSHPYR